MDSFIIFIDFSNLVSGYERAYGHRLDVASFKTVLTEVDSHCRKRDLSPATKVPYIHVYLPDEPGHNLGSEILEFLEVFKRGEIQGVKLRGGLLAVSTERCDRQQNSTENGEWVECTAFSRRTEEKLTEVSLTTDLVRYACRNYYDYAVLISADRDFIPCVRAVQLGERKKVINVFPQPPSAGGKPRSKYQLSGVCYDFCDLQELRADPQVDRALMVSSDRVRFLSGYVRPDGHNLSKDHLRKWVSQFGSERRQELAEILLNNVEFYGRTRMKNIMSSLMEKLLGSRSSEEVGVAVLGNPADSSSLVSYVARDVLSTLGLRVENLTSLARDRKVKTVVFLDDNVGSGMQASEIFLQWFDKSSSSSHRPHVSPLINDTREWLQDRSLAVLTCVSYSEGEEKLHETLEGELGLCLETCKGFTSLDETSGCFHPTSQVYPDPEDREEARELVEEIGYALLEGRGWSDNHRLENALGYGGRQGLSVFFYNTPTSTLPVLWSEGVVDGIPWYPVFLRRER